MHISTFVHPLEAVQFRSVLSYLILLSDFLLDKKILQKTDLGKPIPTVNAMYNYLLDPNAHAFASIDDNRLNELSKYLIRNSDLYGLGKKEVLDPHFVQSLFNHIINSLVFKKYGNVYGFIAEAVRTSNFTTDSEIRASVWGKLKSETFQNSDGSFSKLNDRLVIKIFQEYILPVFPRTENETSIFSIDYAYAQAGSMFFRSLSNVSVDPTTQEEYKDQQYHENKHFDEYIRVAHTVEQLVSTKKIDHSALRIFAVPALLHYVREKKEDLRNKTIAEIINDQTEWQNAFKYLFTNLGDFFQTVDRVQDKNYRFTFLHALQTYKNRTSLARSYLERNCETSNNTVDGNKLTDYLQCTQDCFCLKRGKTIQLTPVDTLFKKQFQRTVDIYARYERESLKSIFPEEIKTLMSNQKVEVKKGLFENRYIADIGPSIKNAKEMQAVPEEHDILLFYFPETETSVYYGLIRKDFEVSLINETYDEQFKEKLGLDRFTYIIPWKFTIPLKSDNENFDVFLTNIVKERVRIFESSLRVYKTETKEQPWWKEFLLSLIPFYTCAQAIEKKDVDLAEMACSLDIFIFIPSVVEVSIALKELTAVTSEGLAKISLTSIKSATARLSFRAAIRSGGRILMEQGMKFTESFTPKLFKKVGIAVVRMVDPGFELLYSLGKGGLRSIGELVALMEKKYPRSFSLIQETLKNAIDGINTVTRKVTEKIVSGVFKNEKVYCNSLKKHSGYGYKFIISPEGKIATLRSVQEFPYKVPVFSPGSDIYEETYTVLYKRKTKQINEMYVIDGIDKVDKTHAYEIERRSVHLAHSSELKLTERDFKVQFRKSLLSCVRRRVRRSPDEPCSRTSLWKEMDAGLKEAVKLVSWNPMKKLKIEKELGKYLFLEDSKKKMLEFVNDWKKNDFMRVPDWSKEYRIELPEVYRELRYSEELSKSRKRFSSKDSYRYRDYKARNLKLHLSFKDYKYMYVFAHERIKISPPVWRAKESLYRLAIRQSDDIITEYDKWLYFVENRPTKTIDKIFRKGEDFEFDEFISTSTSDFYAPKYAPFRQGKYETKVFYHMSFSDTYLRAKFEIFTGDINREETVLLPGSKFKITDVKKETLLGGDKTVTVKMAYQHKSKLEDIKSVMVELKKLKEMRKVMKKYKNKRI